jgi:hypothetical protein
LFQTLGALLSPATPAQATPLLRLQQGAPLVREERLERIVALVAPLLTVAAARLPRLTTLAAGARVRPKLRLSLGLGGAGLVAQVRYFGETPTDVQLRAGFTDAGPGVCPLPPLHGPLAPAVGDGGLGLARGEVCLRAVAALPPRRLAVVRVMAGPRLVGLPMFSVARAVTRDSLEQEPPHTCSLAQILGEEPTPCAAGRAALLVLRRRGPVTALRVEALLGHGGERILPAGPLMSAVPGLLGVLDEDGGPPTLVLDPLGLPGLPQGDDD